MAIDQRYGGLIWTYHALEKVNKRGLTQEMVWTTWRSPDTTRPGNAGSTMYEKLFGISTVTAIMKQNEKNEWLILTCWIDPPLPGSVDEKQKHEYKNYKKAGFFKKFLYAAKKQLGM